MVLHDANMTTLVVAPLDNLKHAGMYRNDSANNGTGTDWGLGVYSQVTSLPRNFSHRTVMVGGAGLTDTLAAYGALVMRIAGTNKSAAATADVVVNKLGYWTDNGAHVEILHTSPPTYRMCARGHWWAAGGGGAKQLSAQPHQCPLGVSGAVPQRRPMQ